MGGQPYSIPAPAAEEQLGKTEEQQLDKVPDTQPAAEVVAEVSDATPETPVNSTVVTAE